MSVLPDWEIRERCDSLLKGFGGPPALIQEFDEEYLQPSSYDVKLASFVLVPSSKFIHPIDTRKPAENRSELVDISDGFLLSQGRFVLGSTQEWVNIHTDIVGRIEGKSSRARQGIQIHSAGYLDPGFCGNVTLEIVNFSPDAVLLWPDVLIAQLSFEKMTDHCETPYGERNNHYQFSKGVVGSRYNNDL
jgi:dCTP deaminase